MTVGWATLIMSAGFAVSELFPYAVVRLFVSEDGGGDAVALIDMAAEADLGLDVNVIIRPREGNFLYTAEEAEIMRRDIAYCREAGVHGVVIGALTTEGDIDMEMCRRMIDAAGEMSVLSTAHSTCAERPAALWSRS